MSRKAYVTLDTRYFTHKHITKLRDLVKAILLRESLALRQSEIERTCQMILLLSKNQHPNFFKTFQSQTGCSLLRYPITSTFHLSSEEGSKKKHHLTNELGVPSISPENHRNSKA